MLDSSEITVFVWVCVTTPVYFCCLAINILLCLYQRISLMKNENPKKRLTNVTLLETLLLPSISLCTSTIFLIIQYGLAAKYSFNHTAVVVLGALHSFCRIGGFYLNCWALFQTVMYLLYAAYKSLAVPRGVYKYFNGTRILFGMTDGLVRVGALSTLVILQVLTTVIQKNVALSTISIVANALGILSVLVGRLHIVIPLTYVSIKLFKSIIDSAKVLKSNPATTLNLFSRVMVLAFSCQMVTVLHAVALIFMYLHDYVDKWFMMPYYVIADVAQVMFAVGIMLVHSPLGKLAEAVKALRAERNKFEKLEEPPTPTESCNEEK